MQRKKILTAIVWLLWWSTFLVHGKDLAMTACFLSQRVGDWNPSEVRLHTSFSLLTWAAIEVLSIIIKMFLSWADRVSSLKAFCTVLSSSQFMLCPLCLFTSPVLKLKNISAIYLVFHTTNPPNSQRCWKYLKKLHIGLIAVNYFIKNGILSIFILKHFLSI